MNQDLHSLSIIKTKTNYVIILDERNTQVNQKFCIILLTYLLYSSSYKKSNLVFTVEAIVLHHLKPPFNQFFDSILIPVLILQGEEFLHWRFHFLLFVDMSQVQEVSHGLELAIIWWSLVWTTCWLWYQFILLSPRSLLWVVQVVWVHALSDSRRAHFLLTNVRYFCRPIAYIHTSCIEYRLSLMVRLFCTNS